MLADCHCVIVWWITNDRQESQSGCGWRSEYPALWGNHRQIKLLIVHPVPPPLLSIPTVSIARTYFPSCTWFPSKFHPSTASNDQPLETEKCFTGLNARPALDTDARLRREFVSCVGVKQRLTNDAAGLTLGHGLIITSRPRRAANSRPLTSLVRSPDHKYAINT